MLKNPTGVKRDTCRQNSRIFLAKFIDASLLDVSAAIRAENADGLIANDSNSDGEHKRSVNGHSCMDRFVR
jgi:hypothetical protein